MIPDDGHPVSTLRDSLEVLRRSKWLVLLVAVIAPVVAVLVASREPALYEASAQVLINRQNLATQLDNLTDPATLDPARAARTNAQLARVPEVAKRALEAAGMSDRSPSELLDASSVTPTEETDLLVFSVNDANPRIATRLATEYAQAFTSYRRELDATALAAARTNVQQRIGELEAAGDRNSALYRSLLEKDQQLATMEALQTGRAVVVRVPTSAAKVRPQPERSGVVGLVLGVALAVAFAFLRDALDSRVRSTRDVVDRLGLPLLGRVPKPPRRLRRTKQPVMLAAPFSHDAEAFRMLRSKVELANFEPAGRVIMVTSAGAREGKSTTAANLAVAFASANRNTILVDLDLRASLLEDAFGVEGGAGLTDVASGDANLEDALVLLPVDQIRSRFRTNGDGAWPAGELRGLPAGARPPHPADFATLQAIPEILEELSRRADIVLVDAPPLLVAGDAVALTAYVDGIIVVTRLNVVHEQALDELRHLLEACPAAKLGFVVTGGDDRADYYDDGYRAHSVPSHGSIAPGNGQPGREAKTGTVTRSPNR